MGFPSDFLWGASTSGFQSEMGNPEGLNVDCKSDWFLWVHEKSNIEKGIVSGDFPENGVNSWDHYEKDHDVACKIGLNAYRISVEWSRIFPRSTTSVETKLEMAGKLCSWIEINLSSLKKLDKIANGSAIIHYRKVIEDLRKKGFKVFVCLNHFTLPLWIHNPIVARNSGFRNGPRGWIDKNTIIEFAKYAAYCAWKLGDLVDEWVTFNEPMVPSEMGYLNSQFGFPPGANEVELFKRAALNITVAHARAYDAIKSTDTFRADKNSMAEANIGLIHNVIPAMPLNHKSNLDVEKAESFDYLHNHFILQSVTEGWLDENLNGLKEQGETKECLRERIDWVGVNYYTRSVFKGQEAPSNSLPSKNWVIPEATERYGFLCEPNSFSADGNPTSDFGWEIYPVGLIYALKSMQRYKRKLIIMENGVADRDDVIRPRFIVDHLEMLDRALNEEKIDVKGYFHWSLTNNYEWAKGFSMKFGLCEIRMDTKDRLPRKSAEVYAAQIAERNSQRQIGDI